MKESIEEKNENGMNENRMKAAGMKEADVSKMTMAERCVYQNRRKAVGLYQKGCTAMEIFRATGINRGTVARLWKRCCAKDPETGECLGYEALVPRSKMKKFIR